jgi:hypothetical protein
MHSDQYGGLWLMSVTHWNARQTDWNEKMHCSKEKCTIRTTKVLFKTTKHVVWNKKHSNLHPHLHSHHMVPAGGVGLSGGELFPPYDSPSGIHVHGVWALAWWCRWYWAVLTSECIESWMPWLCHCCWRYDGGSVKSGSGSVITGAIFACFLIMWCACDEFNLIHNYTVIPNGYTRSQASIFAVYNLIHNYTVISNGYTCLRRVLVIAELL